MKRQDFLKYFGLGIAATVAAPKLLAEALEEVKAEQPDNYYKELIERSNWLRENPRTYEEAFEWHEQGHVHRLYDVEVIKVSKHSIHVKIEREAPFRVYDTVLMNDGRNYYITDIISGINSDFEEIRLCPYNVPYGSETYCNYSVGDRDKIMSIGSYYENTNQDG